jgi:hypothetical protein
LRIKAADICMTRVQTSSVVLRHKRDKAEHKDGLFYQRNIFPAQTSENTAMLIQLIPVTYRSA